MSPQSAAGAPSAALAHSNVVVFPPVIPLTGIVLGFALEQVVPLSEGIPVLVRAAMRCTGSVVLGVGAIGFAWMVRTMKKARTPIHNAKTPTTLVETGPFALTRNPMYLFGSMAYAGLSLLLVKPWALALLPVVLAVTHHGVVLREEEYLDRRFGDAYARYKARVRRWL